MSLCPRCNNPIDVAIHFGQKFCRNCGCRLDHPKDKKIDFKGGE